MRVPTVSVQCAFPATRLSGKTYGDGVARFFCVRQKQQNENCNASPSASIKPTVINIYLLFIYYLFIYLFWNSLRMYLSSLHLYTIPAIHWVARFKKKVINSLMCLLTEGKRTHFKHASTCIQFSLKVCHACQCDT